MGAYITGVCLLILSICQFNEARILDNAEFKIRNDSLTPMSDDSEDMDRNPNHFQRMSTEWSKRIRQARNCKDGILCNGETNESLKNQKPCLGSFGCENRIYKKVFKQSRRQEERSTKNVSPATLSSTLKRMALVLEQMSPCPAGNPKCERPKTLPTNTKIFYRCATGLLCPKERDYHRIATNSRKGGITGDTSLITAEGQGQSKAIRSSASVQKDARPEKESAGKESLGNDENHGKLLCANGFSCEKSKAENDGTSNKLTDIKVENCPIGLWCATKRELGYESSATLEQCPPGLWCKRNRIRFNKDPITKRVDKKNDEEGCPSGFRCSFKREEGYENFESLSQCPPGLWCKRDEIKSEDDPNETHTDKELCPVGHECSTKREEGFENLETLNQCPPGLWCKRDTSVAKKDITELNAIKEYCPRGLTCSSKRLVDYENSETFHQCPPGLWCKRSLPTDDSTFKEQENSRRREGYCLAGSWCALKRDVVNAARNMLDQCPPGLWCKRHVEKIQGPSTEKRGYEIKEP